MNIMNQYGQISAAGVQRASIGSNIAQEPSKTSKISEMARAMSNLRDVVDILEKESEALFRDLDTAGVVSPTTGATPGHSVQESPQYTAGLPQSISDITSHVAAIMLRIRAIRDCLAL